MSYEYVYKDNSLYCKEFQQAVIHFNNNTLSEAARYFQLAYESVNSSDIYHNKYASFCGLVRVLLGDYGGLSLCRDAARSEYYDGDVYLNLARAEWTQKSRKRTVAAIMKGLAVDETHPGLQQLKNELGIRKRNPLPLLSRQNYLNCLIGKILRKENRPDCKWLFELQKKIKGKLIKSNPPKT